MFQNPRRGKQEILQQMLQNSRSQIVFQTDIFGKLMLGAPEYRYSMVEKCSAFFERIWYPFEWLGVSLQKKLSSIRMAWAINSEKIVVRLNSLGYPSEKKMSSIWTAWAVRLEKIVISSNSLGYPFQKIVIRSDG